MRLSNTDLQLQFYFPKMKAPNPSEELVPSNHAAKDTVAWTVNRENCDIFLKDSAISWQAVCVRLAAADSQRLTLALPEPSAPWSSDNCTVVTAAAGAAATFSVWTEERDLSLHSLPYQTGYLAEFTHFPFHPLFKWSSCRMREFFTKIKPDVSIRKISLFKPRPRKQATITFSFFVISFDRFKQMSG
jgi:hypothetical protein